MIAAPPAWTIRRLPSARRCRSTFRPRLETLGHAVQPLAHSAQRGLAVGDREIHEIDVDREAREVAHEQVDRRPALQGEVRLRRDLRNSTQQQRHLVDEALRSHASPSRAATKDAGTVIW